MKSVQKTVVVPHSAANMFDLVSDVPAYPEFLPWCASASVLETTPRGKIAEVEISLGALQHSFVTRNCEQVGQQIDIHLVRGPFAQLEGRWLFTPLEEGKQAVCRIDFNLHYCFSSKILSMLMAPAFEHITHTLVDAFISRAKILNNSNDINGAS